eukprot:gb/GECH01003271.1/.p1 GENE.gb/GECH01003271.1/~~gb/GECH01003271.1/.p1  ORF type:complete len:214 (+),score=51.43 gb/GECH01003271.1/:1-642(+)
MSSKPSQIDQMISFITREAQEKADEIRVNAEEQKNYDKQEILKQEKAKIRAEFEKKESQVDVKKKIARSNEIKKERLKVLKRREELIKELRKDAEEGLRKFCKDKGKYEGLLKNLMVQGMLALMEEQVTILCRKADFDIVKKAAKNAEKDFKERTGKNCKVEPTQQEYLDEDSLGGVKVFAKGDRIKCSNTLDSRLDLVFAQRLPEIRSKLFD